MFGILLILFQLNLGSDKAFESQLKNYLDRKLAEYERYEYEITELPKNYFKIELDDERELKLNKNYAIVPVRVYDKNNRSSRSLITLKVKLFKKVLVAAQDIEREQPLSDFQFVEKLYDITLIRGNPVLNSESLIGKRSKVKIKNGSILIDEMTESIPDVFLNERLILHAGSNGVDISTEVTAREEGKIGDIIRVVTNDNKIFKAKIIDKFNVSLIE